MIYLYDVICYAHPCTSVPTNNALTHAHTHTLYAHNILFIHTFYLAYTDKSTHTRGHTQTCTCVPSRFFLTLFFGFTLTLSFSHSLTRNIHISAFTDEYMPMYVRVHIQSTSRMCFFYKDYNFIIVFDWKKKQQRTNRPNLKYHHSIII